MRNPATIVTYITKSGAEQKGLVYTSDQRAEYSTYGKVFIRLVNDDFSEKMEGKKKVIAIKNFCDLKVIGFQD